MPVQEIKQPGADPDADLDNEEAVARQQPATPPPTPLPQNRTAPANDPAQQEQEKRPDQAAPAEPSRDGNHPPDANNDKNDPPHGGTAPDDGQGKKRFRTVVMVLVIGFAILLVVGIIPRLRSRPKLRADANRQSQAPEVDVTYPTLGPAITRLSLPGNIAPVQSTDINARASGYVSQWLVDIGDRVKAGQVLAVISAPDADQQEAQARAQVVQAEAVVAEQRAELARAQASLEQSRQNARKQKEQLVQAEADLHLAKLTWDRWNDLVRQGAVSQQAADEKQAAYNNNKANVASLVAAVGASASDIAASQASVVSAQENVRAAQAQEDASRANLKRFAVLRSFNKVRAPFAGVITARMIDQGAIIGGSASGSTDTSSGNTVSAQPGGSSASSTSSSSSGSAATSTSSTGGSRTAMYNSAADSTIAGASTSAASSGGSAAASAPAGGTVPSGSSSTSAAGASSSSGSTGSQSGSTTSGLSALDSGGSIGTSAGTAAAQNAAGSGGASAQSPASSGSTSTTAASARAPLTGSGPSTGLGGTVVTSGVSLFTLARIDVLRIQVNVPQAFAPNIRVGQKSSVSVQEYPGVVFRSSITRTASALDQTTRTMLTEVQLPNNDRKLLPGMFAQVNFDVVRTIQPLLIPSGALIYNAQNTQVATVGQDNKIHIVPVQVGRDYGPTVEIFAKGIDAHTAIVTDPNDTTREGAAVRGKLSTSGSDAVSPGGGSGNGGDKTKATNGASNGQPAGNKAPAQGQTQNPPAAKKGGSDSKTSGGSGGGTGQPPPNTGATYGGGTAPSPRPS